MTNEEMVRRLAEGYLPVEQSKEDDAIWIGIPPDTLRVSADDDSQFVQVIDHTIVAVWDEEDVRWLEPPSDCKS